MPIDYRLLEDHVPIEAVSAEAQRAKLICKGHILAGCHSSRVGCAAAVGPGQ